MYQEFEVMVMGQQMKKLLEHECEELMRSSDLRKVELDILYFVSHAGERDTARDITMERHISKAHISKSVDNLKQRGYIRLVEDKEDHRCMHIQITSLGEPIIQEFENIRIGMLEKLFTGVTQKERECLLCIMNKVLKNIDAELGCHS